GDEVITTPFTFFATAEAISQVGAVPVFVDIDPRTFNIDPEKVKAAVSARTKALLPVHLYGQAAEMDPLLELARARDLVVVEDVAQAFGGEYKGKKLGTLGRVGCFSFFPSKNLGAFGDGGLIVTDDDRVAELARMLRVHGSKQRYYHELIGYNSRLDEFQAAILRVKLPHVSEWNERRREVARRYDELLGDLPEVITPYENPHARHVYHQYTIRILGGKRDAVHRHLAEMGIATMIYYPVPLHRLPPYAEGAPHLPVAEAMAGEVLSLPCGPMLAAAVQEEVAHAIRAAL
ncbi:MAG: DegT/DnrJ/EryC1/StrS family aminotransferase, partial [Firmicutes bacterium]|nr:DegT/DnrJ/EryC1/StrS family aminotransferase [Bacillota bacterium]